MVIEKFVSQFDGCTYMPGGYNCTMAAEAMWLHRASQGRISVSSCTCRTLTGDRSGGTNLSQAEQVSIHYGVIRGVRYSPADFDSIAHYVLTGRYGSHLDISYGTVAHTALDAFHGGFSGNHDIYLSGPGSTPGTIRVGDPGWTSFRDWPISVLKNAAGRLDLGGGQTINSEYGGGKCYAYVTPADPAVATTLYHVVFSGRTTLYSAPNGRIVGAVTRASYAVRKAKVGGLWWYLIVAPGSANNGRWFKPTRYTAVTVI